MLKRSDGECLLTQEIYDNARRGILIPCNTMFYDGDSDIHIYRQAYGDTNYCLGDDIILGCVSEYTIEELRSMCMPNDQPLPSEKAEAPLTDSKLDEILRRLDKLEKKDG